MKQYLIIGTTAVIVLLSSCGGKKDNNGGLSEKKAQLEKLKEQVKTLQAEVDKLDTSAANAQKAKLVAVQTIQLSDFTHYIKLQGKIDAENISYIAPSGAPGLVKAVYVKQGDHVRKGQALLKLDDAVMKQAYVTAQQNVENAKTQLAYLQNIYQRQQNLWNQNIGTEVQVISAKNNAATAENQLKTAQESAKQALAQLNTTNVNSDVDGIADIVNIRVGETFQGMTQQGPQIEIVNNSNLKAKGVIPENYLSSVSKGAAVIVTVPDVNKTINTTLSFVSASIDPLTRGFNVEAKLPTETLLKPNQVVEMKIKDYAANNSIVVPVATLQNDLTGKYIMVAVKEGGKLIAHKRTVTIGSINDDQLEIKEGLKAGDVLITDGFQGLYDGQVITTQ
ncbi:efflux RND transporter periplasmic adaptor subunit [Ferruginibacter albus]|uniref:efflux RND transporter periplasmic adaptor subunit n=1 Tax=Ferruginibacter albus TaxID=2875540 RepID=UPI001CC6B6C1|nr:efflux RND transporter periplasmic adaptor subunit [Ferruginibacter albus]UAY52185.1 efflux RND transporter periplasmic adaptor subunit [Ferruginibacter albus]